MKENIGHLARITALSVGLVIASKGAYEHLIPTAEAGGPKFGTTQVIDSRGDTYNVTVSGEFVGITSNSKTSFSTEGAIEIAGQVDEVCEGIGDPSIAEKTGEVVILFRAEPNCLAKLAQ